MTELNGGQVPQGGVLLGSRELRLRINPDAHRLLQFMSNVSNRPQHALAEDLLMQAIHKAWGQLVMDKLAFMMANWYLDWRVVSV